jgi:hypothetical protein
MIEDTKHTESPEEHALMRDARKDMESYWVCVCGGGGGGWILNMQLLRPHTVLYEALLTVLYRYTSSESVRYKLSGSLLGSRV